MARTAKLAFGMALSFDGGKSWSKELLPVTFHIYDLYLANKKLFAVGSEGKIIYKIVK